MDKTDDCAMRSEPGALGWGYDPLSGHNVCKTTRDRWRDPARSLIQTHVGAPVYETGDKISRSLSDGKK